MKLFRYIARICKWARGSVVFVVLVCLSLYMQLIQIKHKQNIADFFLSTVFYLPQSAASYLVHIGELSKENTELKKENARLKLKEDLAREYAIENERLKDLLGIIEQHWDNFPTVLTQIIGQNPGPYTTTVVVSRGVADSISYGMPVFTTRGLVGKISKVFTHHSMVQLLSDPNSVISVVSQRSRELGTVFSRDNGNMQIQISSYANLVQGDTLVTSGFGGIYPKGIPVGVVSKLDKNNSEVLSYGNIELLQPVESLEEAFIIRKNTDWIVWEWE